MSSSLTGLNDVCERTPTQSDWRPFVDELRENLCRSGQILAHPVSCARNVVKDISALPFSYVALGWLPSQLPALTQITSIKNSKLPIQQRVEQTTRPIIQKPKELVIVGVPADQKYW